jgi:uncharacterized SAM-binding protein YcdF (DUF218 family)
MAALITRLIDKLLSWEGFLAIVAVALVALWRRPGSRGARAWLTGATIVYTILSIPLVPYGIAQLIGWRYQIFAASPGDPIQVIVLLGGAVGTVIGAEQQMGLMSDVAMGRVLEAARVYRALNEPLIISSGGSSRAQSEKSGDTMKLALVQLGVRPERIIVESQSRTTRDEAVLIAPMLRRLHSERFVLVTHRSHMPRAEGAFRAQGLTPVPAIVPDELSASELKRSIKPDVASLQRSGLLFHEALGLAYYWWRGWM